MASTMDSVPLLYETPPTPNSNRRVMHELQLNTHASSKQIKELQDSLVTGKNLSARENQHPIDQIDVATVGEAAMSFANRLRMEKENESPLEKQQKTKKDAAAAQHAGKKRAHNEFDREEEEADNNGGEDSNAAVTEDDGSEMVVYEWDCDKVRQMIRGFLEENGTLASEFQDTIGVSPAVYSRFMGQNGKWKGQGSTCMLGAYKFFKAREARGEPEPHPAGLPSSPQRNSPQKNKNDTATTNKTGNNSNESSDKNTASATTASAAGTAGSPPTAKKRRTSKTDSAPATSSSTTTSKSPKTATTKKKTKADDPTSKNYSPDFSNIALPGEDRDAVPVFDSCDEIRRKITAYFKKHPNVTQAQFLRDVAAQVHTEGPDFSLRAPQLNSFRKKKGPNAGATARVYYAAYVFFEKLRIKEGKDKTKHRLGMEQAWGKKGMDLKHDASAHVFCHISERPYIDQYGRLEIQKRY